ncbi:thioredoxin family protein [Candidatus Woesearchaeota archaeon]|nr:thioredoxin family protein [Candidatus Woesearchaeota archaeon]
MKANNFLAILLILSVIALGCAKTTSTDSAEKNSMMDNEAGEMAEIGFEMKDGKMLMVDEKAKTMSPMEKNAVLNDGTRVMTDGKVIRKDGTLFMLNEGESIWMDGSFMKAGEMMEDNDGGMMEASYLGKVLAGSTTKYLEFKKADYDKALKENKKILLYFYASWCPTCRAEQPETFAAFDEINDSDLIGFRVNFRDSDTDADEEAIAKEFGVSYQHTKVILKNGERVLKAPDSWDRQRYLEELKKI